MMTNDQKYGHIQVDGFELGYSDEGTGAATIIIGRILLNRIF